MSKISNKGNKVIELKKTLIKAKNIIKKKFQDLHAERLAFDERTAREYKPIIKPLNEIEKNTKKGAIKKEEKEEEAKPEGSGKNSYSTPKAAKTGVLPKRLFETNTEENGDSEGDITDGNTSDKLDEEEDSQTFESPRNRDSMLDSSSLANTSAQSSKNTFRESIPYITVSDFHYTAQFKPTTNEMRLGSRKVVVDDSVIKVSTKNFISTPGVQELLLSSNPKSGEYNENDLQVYKSILEFTSAHRENYQQFHPIVRDESNPKYVNIIKRLYPPTGGSLKKNPLQTNFMTYNKFKAFDYKYWDDPNELVERLKLLVASQEAGHNSHNNEIISIIEELREANIVV